MRAGNNAHLGEFYFLSAWQYLPGYIICRGSSRRLHLLFGRVEFEAQYRH